MDVINLILFGFIVYSTLIAIPGLYDYYKAH
jgi:hypothetical protein